MRRAGAAIPLLAAGLVASGTVLVASGVRGDEGQVARGARIAALGNGRGAPACASCHAFDGSGDPSGAFPRLSGQPAHYMGYALATFAEGTRRNSVMTPIAKSLSAEERGDVSAYYASVAAPVPPHVARDPAMVDRGRVIANVGIEDQQVPACVACHGPAGRSVNPTVPTLAGQYARYLAFELRMFSERYRESDQMDDLAHTLTEDQRQEIAAYFQQVDPTLTKPAALADAGNESSQRGTGQ